VRPRTRERRRFKAQPTKGREANPPRIARGTYRADGRERMERRILTGASPDHKVARTLVRTLS
jgi:hypothetical protein